MLSLFLPLSLSLCLPLLLSLLPFQLSPTLFRPPPSPLSTLSNFQLYCNKLSAVSVKRQLACIPCVHIRRQKFSAAEVLDKGGGCSLNTAAEVPERRTFHVPFILGLVCELVLLYLCVCLYVDVW